MAQSLSGQFLISAKQLRDPNFFRSVVLMVEHGSNGAMGLVVNRPSSISVSAALEDHFKIPENDEKVYIGGPVDQEALFILHNFSALDGSEAPLVSGLFVGSNAEIFEQVVQSSLDGDERIKYRILAGCAGWGPKQLEDELGRGDWLVTPASVDFIFHEDPYTIWDSLTKGVSLPPHIAPGVHGNPEWN